MKKYNIIISIIAVLLSINTVAQTDDGYNNRTLTEYQNDEEFARKSIVLKPNFNTTGHTSFRAYIDPIAPIGTNLPGLPDEPYNGFESGVFDKNYIKTYTAYKDFKISNPDELTINNSNISYQYFDGLGRPIQTVQLNASPEERDIIQPVVYDNHGRIADEYLPYAVQQDGDFAGGFRTEAIQEQQNYYEHFYQENEFTYSHNDFDGSPLNRLTSVTAQGEAWQANPSSISYETNNGTEVLWTVDHVGNLVNSTTYTAGELYKTTTTDEDGKTSVEYKNKQGQVILTVADGTAKTYYVYDDLGLLRYVLPPKVFDPSTLPAPEGKYTDNTTIANLCYYYEYDHRKRMVLKKLPGVEPIKMVYDERDLLVATQDGEMRKSHKWMFTKYDAFSRPIMTGEYTYNGDLQAHVNGLSELWETYSGTTYSNDAFPANIADANLYSVTYYDDDSYASSLWENYQYTNVYGVDESDKTKGLIMATKTRVLLHDGLTVDEEWLKTVNVYDKYGRVIQTIADNHKGGRDIISNKYNFTGELLESKQEHTNSNIVIDKQFEYDRMGRLQWEKEDLNGAGNWVTTSSNEYNELGQLKTNTIGGKQTVDYQYNIRGWMTHINDPASLGSDLFAMQLKYNDGNSKLYNGNIAQIDWKSKTFGGLKSYEFTYDALNRLDIADFTNDDYKVEYDYDLNGNITNLVRHGKKADESFGEIDNLTYKYSGGGNQLSSVLDAASATDGFSDNGSVGDYEYTYDDNGNMITDGNKNITNITYNFLNLPNQIQVATGSSNQINYLYDAAGIKLQKTASGITTDYIGNFIYEQGVLKYILTSNGRIVVEGSNYNYQYHIKDHLGNTRVTFDATGEVLQEDSYYPFGMAMNGLNYYKPSLDPDNKNKYLYNGKELQDDLGLDWIDYGFRMYDPQLGRWHKKDPMIEFHYDYTPYAYVYNNPVRFIDPFGLDTIEVINQADRNVVVESNDDGSTTVTAHITGSNESSSSDNSEEGSNEEEGEVASFLVPIAEKTDAFDGNLGFLYYIWTGGNLNGVHYDTNGNPAGPAPNMLTAPMVGRGKGVPSLLRWIGRGLKANQTARKVKNFAKKNGIYSGQRGIRKEIISHYLKQMRNGTFDASKGAGGFIHNGKRILTDGNHRMNAAIRYGFETGNFRYVERLINNGNFRNANPASYGIKTYNLPTK